MSATTSSNLARLVLSFASLVMATHATRMSSSLGRLLFLPSVDKAFVVGPGHATLYYVDRALPFSLCSAPYIFRVITDLVQ